jgi:hypothetical protein
MPSHTTASFVRPQSIHRSSMMMMHYDNDHSIQLLGASFSTLGAISEEEHNDSDSDYNNSFTSNIRYNHTKLRRDSFGNQSYRTGLSQLVRCEQHEDVLPITRTLLQRYHNTHYDTAGPITSSSSSGHHSDDRTTTSMSNWGFFIDE